MLTTKGLLVARPRSGTTVQPEDRWNLLDPDVLRWMLERNFSIELLVDFTEVRLAIEPRAAGMAARGATEAQRNHIMEAIGRMIAADAGEGRRSRSRYRFSCGGARSEQQSVLSAVHRSDGRDTAFQHPANECL